MTGLKRARAREHRPLSCKLILLLHVATSYSTNHHQRPLPLRRTSAVGRVCYGLQRQPGGGAAYCARSIMRAGQEGKRRGYGIVVRITHGGIKGLEL
jgi:hypothetical protein